MSRLANRSARLRQLKELLLISPDGLSIAELASHLLVNRRTVYRDVDFLPAQGVPLWQNSGRFGLNRTRYLTTVSLSYQEAVALVLAGLLLARTLDGHPFQVEGQDLEKVNVITSLKGSGKSHLAKVILLQLIGQGAP